MKLPLAITIQKLLNNVLIAFLLMSILCMILLTCACCVVSGVPKAPRSNRRCCTLVATMPWRRPWWACTNMSRRVTLRRPARKQLRMLSGKANRVAAVWPSVFMVREGATALTPLGTLKWSLFHASVFQKMWLGCAQCNIVFSIKKIFGKCL